MDNTISSLISSAEGGDPAAADELFTALYAQLRRMASLQLFKSSAHLTLGTTTLLHEAYLDIAGREGTSFPDRARFMAYAARVMRGLIIDYVRQRRAQRRGGRFEITSLEADVPGPDGEELARIGEAVDDLATIDAPLAHLVDLRFFCGLTFAEIAALRGQSERTVQRHWEKARIFLHTLLQGRQDPSP